MGGTLLQQFGHDAVLQHFIDRFLVARHKDLFYIVSPAMGPKIDIYYWCPEEGRYVSAYETSRIGFVPEFHHRVRFDKDVIERLDDEANYRRLEWYQRLSRQLNVDLKEFVLNLCDSIEAETNDLPDVIAIDGRGKETFWAELKFESFRTGVQDSVMRQFEAAKERGLPFYLVVPSEPLYEPEITDSWLLANLPREMVVYTFASDTPVTTPKGQDIRFAEVMPINI